MTPGKGTHLFLRSIEHIGVTWSYLAAKAFILGTVHTICRYNLAWFIVICNTIVKYFVLFPSILHHFSFLMIKGTWLW